MRFQQILPIHSDQDTEIVTGTQTGFVFLIAVQKFKKLNNLPILDSLGILTNVDRQIWK